MGLQDIVDAINEFFEKVVLTIDVLISAVISFFVSWIGGILNYEIVKVTHCQLKGLESQLICLYFTNSIVSFLLTLIAVLTIIKVLHVIWKKD